MIRLWKSLFAILIMYNVIYDSTMSFKTKGTGKWKEQETYDETTIADKIITFFVSIAFLAGLLFALFNKLVPGIIAILLITVPTVLRHIAESIRAADSIKFIVLENNSNRELLISEKMQFDIFVIGLLLVNQYIPMSKFVSFVENISKSMLVSEIIISVYIILFAFLITFIVLVELIIPLRHLRKGCEFVSLKIGGYSKRVSVYFWKTWDTPLIKARLTNRVLNVSKRHKIVVRIIFFILAILAFVIDLIINFIFIAYSFIICSCLGAVIEFFRILGKGLLRLLRLVTGIPGHKVMKNTFRMSGIVAMFFVVIANRMNLFFIPDDSFIAITELLVSAIVIPTIFEWIYSSRESEQSKIDSD